MNIFVQITEEGFMTAKFKKIRHFDGNIQKDDNLEKPRVLNIRGD